MTARARRPERRFRRRTVRVLVAFEPRSAPEAAGGALRRAYATTLGAGGLFVECEEPPAVGTELRVHFRLGLARPEQALAARVVWLQPPDPPASEAEGEAHPRRVPGMGIEFTEPEERAALARALERSPGPAGPRP